MEKDPLFVLRNEDIFPADYIFPPKKWHWNQKERTAVRLLIVDDEGKIALVGTKYRLLPGGGVEENESLEEAGKREALEEAGVDVEIHEHLGYHKEYLLGDRMQDNYYLIAKVIGEKGEPQTTQEDEIGIIVEWHSLEDAISLIEKQIETIPFASYHSCFGVRANLRFLKKYKERK